MEKLARGNAAMVLDVLGGRLAFERTGVRLYDAVIAKIERSGEARWQRVVEQLRHNRDEEKEHEEWLEAQIRELGGDAHQLTPMARLESEESRGVESVILDGHDRVPDLLHALLAAELADNAGWDLLVKLADEAGDRPAKAAFAFRMAQEAKHLLFIREVVVRAAELEVLGRDVKLPRSTASVFGRMVAKVAAFGGVALALLGGGAAIATALLLGQPRLRRRARRLLRA